MVAKKKVSKEQGAALVARVEAKSAGKVTTDLAQVKHTLTGIVDDVANTTTTLLKELRETQEAIDFKKEELAELFKIEGHLQSAEEYHRLALEAEAAYTETSTELTLRRQREEEQYKYDLAKRRRDEQDGHDQWKADRVAQLTAAWTLRENELAARAAALGDTEAKIRNLEDAIVKNALAAESDAKAKVAIAVNAVTRDLKNDHALALKDEASKNALLTQQVEALKEIVESQREEIAERDESLKAAQAQVQSIANKALESAAAQKVTVNTGLGDPNRK